MAEHDANGTLAAAEPREQGEGGKNVEKAQRIVHQQCPAIALDHLGAIGRYQIGEDREEGDGGVIGDDLDELHHHVRKAGEPLADNGVLTAGHLHGKAEQHGKYDKGQHGPAAQKAHKVLCREEIDDHFCHGSVFTDLLGGKVGPRHQHRREQLHQHEHDNGGNSAGNYEGADGSGHDFSGPLAAVHIGNGPGNGGKHQRDHDAEHQVDENLS